MIRKEIIPPNQSSEIQFLSNDPWGIRLILLFLFFSFLFYRHLPTSSMSWMNASESSVGLCSPRPTTTVRDSSRSRIEIAEASCTDISWPSDSRPCPAPRSVVGVRWVRGRRPSSSSTDCMSVEGWRILSGTWNLLAVCVNVSKQSRWGGWGVRGEYLPIERGGRLG